MFQPQANNFSRTVPSLPVTTFPAPTSSSHSSRSSDDHEARRPYSPGALDVINADRVRQGLPPIRGTENVRNRDTLYEDRLRPSQTYAYGEGTLGASNLGIPESSGLQKFASTRTNTIRPVIFQPNGSFRPLKENGKLQVGPEEADVYKGRIKNPLANTAYHVPGYTGFVRGKQHIAGRTFGETTRRALSSDYREVVCSSPVPSSPQANRKIRQEELKDTFVANMFGGKTYQIPGYTGFVPGVRSTYAKRYGAATEQEMLNHSVRFPRADNQSSGFARTQLPRENYPLSSAPLPGGAQHQHPPEMYIPSNIKYLRFMAM